MLRVAMACALCAVAGNLVGGSPIGNSTGKDPGDLIADMNPNGFYRADVHQWLEKYADNTISWTNVESQLSVFEDATLIVSCRASFGDLEDPTFPLENTDERDDFVAFFGLLADHCGDVIDGYQIGNELHRSYQWPDDKYGELGSLYDEVDTAIAAKDSTYIMVLGGFAVEWLLDANDELDEDAETEAEEILDECGAYIDAIDLHFHQAWYQWDRIDAGFTAMRQVDGASTIPIYVTENTTWEGTKDNVTQTQYQQTLYTLMSTHIALLNGAVGICNGPLHDTSQRLWQRGMYDLSNPPQPKPVAVVVRALGVLLDGYAGIIDVIDDGDVRVVAVAAEQDYVVKLNKTASSFWFPGSQASEPWLWPCAGSVWIDWSEPDIVDELTVEYGFLYDAGSGYSAPYGTSGYGAVLLPWFPKIEVP